MPAVVIGGFQVKSYEGTRSHGPEPASAGGVGVISSGGSVPLSAGDYVAISILGVLFYGVCASVRRSRTLQSGDEYEFTVLDNRVRLRHGIVRGRWNFEQDAAVAYTDPVQERPSTLDQWTGGEVGFETSVDFQGGIESEMGRPRPLVSDGAASRGKVFSHIPPAYWSAQTEVHTSGPMSARDIIEEAVRGSKGGYGLAFTFHSAQSKPVFGVDCNAGTSISAFLQHMADAQGLQMTMDGTKTIRFTRKGEGTVVVPPDAYVKTLGSAISAEPTKVLVVGGSRLVQVNNVPMQPDWNRSWEQFLSEPAWLSEVRTVMSNSGPVNSDPATLAEIAAYAREITLSEYITLKGLAVDDPSDLESEFVDNGRWDGVSRMDLPVWVYLKEIVFRSYRVSSEAEIYGLRIRSLKVVDRLLCAVELAGGEQITYRKAPVEFYPQASAFVIAKGQPLDLASVEQSDALLRARNTDLRETWSPVADFTLDSANHAIHFATPVFKDGAAGSGLFLYPNRGQGGGTNLVGAEGIAEDSTYLDLVVPNPNPSIEPAEIKVALVFEIGIFSAGFGVGSRWTTHHASSIAEHLLHGESGFSPENTASFQGSLGVPDENPDGFLEILFDNGQSALELAEDQAEGLTSRSGTEQFGSYYRVGSAGSSLNGAVDRVSTRLTMEDGLTEEVEFAKPRVRRGFQSSREIAERLRNEEMFAGQKELLREVRELRAISRRLRLGNSSEDRGVGPRTMPDVFRQPMCSGDGDCRVIADVNQQFPEADAKWLAGHLVWLDASGLPSRAGMAFGGVVVMEGQSNESASLPAEYISIAKSGIVPVRVKRGILAGGLVMADPGDAVAGAKGGICIGRLMHAEAVPDTGSDDSSVIALVRLGSAGKPGGRFIVTHDPAGSRLYVSEGTVGCSNAYYPSSFIRPLDVTLDGVKLSNDPPPSFEVGESGDFEVVCVFDYTKGRIELVNKEEPLHLNNCERGWLIATVSFKEEGGKFVIDKAIDQRWESDIPWQFNDQSIDCSSEDSSEDSNDSDESGNSDDSGGSTDSDESGGSNDSSDDGDSGDFSGDSSDESDESMDPCCGTSTNPIIRITEANVAVAGDGARNCFPSSGSAMVFVFVTVTISGNPCDCGNTYLRITARGVTIANVYLGVSPVGTFSYVGEIMASACEDLPIRACVYTSGVAEEDPCRGLLCCASTTAKAPPPCDESCDGDSGSGSGESSDESGSGSGSGGSEESGGSSDESGSGSGGSDDKNCIMQMPDGSYAAMSCFETGNNHLGHFMFDVPVTGRLTRVPIDRRFLFVCIPGTIRVTATETGSIRRAAATTMDGDHIVIHSGLFLRPATVNVTLVGIKKDADRPWDPRTQRQWLKNKAFYQKLNAEPPP